MSHLKSSLYNSQMKSVVIMLNSIYVHLNSNNIHSIYLYFFFNWKFIINLLTQKTKVKIDLKFWRKKIQAEVMWHTKFFEKKPMAIGECARHIWPFLVIAAIGKFSRRQYAISATRVCFPGAAYCLSTSLDMCVKVHFHSTTRAPATRIRKKGTFSVLSSCKLYCCATLEVPG